MDLVQWRILLVFDSSKEEDLLCRWYYEKHRHEQPELPINLYLLELLIDFGPILTFVVPVFNDFIVLILAFESKHDKQSMLISVTHMTVSSCTQTRYESFLQLETVLLAGLRVFFGVEAELIPVAFP